MSRKWATGIIAGLFLAVLFCFGFVFKAQINAASDYLKLASPNNGWFSTRIFPIKGMTSSKAQTVRVVYNGIPFMLQLYNGSFERNFVASPGINNIYAESVTASGQIVKDQISFFSKAPAKALKIFLTWDTNGTDLDLWVTEPTGEKCYYGYRNTKIGGTLDVDVTDGYGPEVYTVAAAVKGNYLIQVNSYSDYRNPQTEAKIFVVMHEGTAHETVKEFEAMITQAGTTLVVDTIHFQ